jgi:nucleoside-diphosphate-sugar epimerase
VRLLHLGSALEYGTTGGELAEDSPCAPTTLYGRTKLAGTELVQRRSRETELPALTARLFTVVGQGEHEGRLLPSLIAAARSGERIPLTDGVQRRDIAFVGDVVDALARIVGCRVAPGEIVNVATGRLHTIRALIEETARRLGIDSSRLEFGTLPTRAEEQAITGVTVERLRSLIGDVPNGDLETIVRRAIGPL